MPKPEATQRGNKNNKRYCGQSKQQVFEEFCGESKFLFFSPMCFPSVFFDRAHTVNCSSKYLLAVNDAHQSLLLRLFTSLQNWKFNFRGGKKKVSSNLCSNSWFAFTKTSSPHCMTATNGIVCANCLGQKITLHEKQRKAKDDFDDLDQNSSRMEVGRGGMFFLHGFVPQENDASRSHTSCCELTKYNDDALHTPVLKILCTSN